MDICEAQILRMEEELRGAGVWMPPSKGKAINLQQVETATMDPTLHHHVAKSNNDPIYLEKWIGDHPNDPALKVSEQMNSA